SITRFISLAARRGGQNILSVGRVQTPTLSMIVDREKEIEAFVPEKYWQLALDFEKRGEVIEARHTNGRFHEKAAAEQARDRTQSPLVVTEVRTGTKQDRAPSPFDTTTYIVAAARLGLSAANAMRIAEDLYMNGFISYPRTDNTVYPPSLDIDGILKTLKNSPFRKDVEWVLAHRREVPTRGKKSSTDHPPIHPTGAATREQLGDDAFKVYELVLRRFLATLAPDALWKTLKILFDANGEEYTSTGGQLTEPGWHAVYPFSEARETLLPEFIAGEKLPIKKVTLDEKETQPPARYTQSKLIQRMEELGLGTKSTRHEVIAKLVSRKYVEGNPLRPTLVGRVVTEALEQHADAITKPAMTQIIESHMQLIKQSQRTREDVIRESRVMLHRAFDQLEANQQVIGDDIRDRTAEEMNLGKCPVCGGTLAIKHLRGNTQFIGCSRYPDCSFNIGLPMAQWGFAVRTDEICEKHHLHFVLLVRKGARPWEIGCPLCHQLTSNRESLEEIPSADKELVDRIQANHIYTVAELAHSTPEVLAKKLNLANDRAATLIHDAGRVLEKLRRRSECRKFMRERIIPRRGRSSAKILTALKEAGISELSLLAKADITTLKKAGVSDTEAEQLLADAKMTYHSRVLKEIGIPGVSLKKYIAAGILEPEAFCASPPAVLSEKTGMSLSTVQRHVGMVCTHLNRPVPKKFTKQQIEKGKKQLLAIRGLTEPVAIKLFGAGIIDAGSLLAADPVKVAAATGIAEQKIRDYQKSSQRKKDTAIIQL
ncbi:MAG: DNA topoisomerase, partial [Methanoregula sp.]|nr:DNA topoisomerase [Methanoregula sp.]